ncbi:MAG: hypothetical protein A4S09_03345 [Proteobacteria bacterium SG_bin7]|nr:MAG: hypothetical protein A4S09_03345 [Proteobacteria bacterium SG_bin7]
MKKKISSIVTTIVLLVAPLNSRADLFGTDTAVLTQILANAVQQLVQLRQILTEGQNSLSLMRDINRGINDSLNLIRTVFPNADPGLYREWDKIQDAMNGIEKIYGVVVSSREAPIQRDTDQNIGEAIALNNSIYKYTRDIDEISETIKQYSHSVSPGGAQKLTAQSLGIMLTVMNQSLRTQATGLKLQAQSLALQNHKDKELTRSTLENAQVLSVSMKSQETSFKMPRF